MLTNTNGGAPMEASSAGEAAELAHERTAHEGAQLHHHHTHAATSSHGGGHHLLQVEDLNVSFRMYDEDAPYFQAKQHDVQVLHELSIAVHAGEIVAVVGASGSGKTLLADAVLGLFEPNATVTGRIWFDGERMDAAGLRALRGHGLSLVPQSVSHLDPMMRVGKQVEGFANDLSKAERKTRRAQLFERYGLGPEVARLYPHELSGGMARRVLLCCALMDSPRVIVADEPTPGLDLDLAVRALDDFRTFANEGNGVLLITHDIELALRVADRVAVFKDGTVVKETATASFADSSLLRHPFTRELWHALPEHDFAVGESAGGKAPAQVREDGEEPASPLVPARADVGKRASELVCRHEDEGEEAPVPALASASEGGEAIASVSEREDGKEPASQPVREGGEAPMLTPEPVPGREGEGGSDGKEGDAC